MCTVDLYRRYVAAPLCGKGSRTRRSFSCIDRALERRFAGKSNSMSPPLVGDPAERSPLGRKLRFRVARRAGRLRATAAVRRTWLYIIEDIGRRTRPVPRALLNSSFAIARDVGRSRAA